MALITVNENCFARKGFELYLKYELATIYLINFTIVGVNCVLVIEMSGNLGLGNIQPLQVKRTLYDN